MLLKNTQNFDVFGFPNFPEAIFGGSEGHLPTTYSVIPMKNHDRPFSITYPQKSCSPNQTPMRFILIECILTLQVRDYSQLKYYFEGLTFNEPVEAEDNK